MKGCLVLLVMMPGLIVGGVLLSAAYEAKVLLPILGLAAVVTFLVLLGPDLLFKTDGGRIKALMDEWRRRG